MKGFPSFQAKWLDLPKSMGCQNQTLGIAKALVIVPDFTPISSHICNYIMKQNCTVLGWLLDVKIIEEVCIYEALIIIRLGSITD